MTTRTTISDFATRCIARMKLLGSILCVGLDPQLEKMPPHLVQKFLNGREPTDFKAIADLFIAFNMAIIDGIRDIAVWVKPNIAFYEEYGAEGLRAYEATINYARKCGLLVICDGKRGDGGDTAKAYAEGHLGQVTVWNTESQTFIKVNGPIQVDALTIESIIGKAGMDHYIAAAIANGTAPIFVTKTSFEPNSAIEQIQVMEHDECVRVWHELALMVDKWGGEPGEHGWKSVWAVIGATFPTEGTEARALMRNTWFLVPGYGAQGGGPDDAVVAANQEGFGICVNSSRDIIYAFNKKGGNFNGPSENFANSASRAADHSRNALNEALKRAGKGEGTFWKKAA